MLRYNPYWPSNFLTANGFLRALRTVAAVARHPHPRVRRDRRAGFVAGSRPEERSGAVLGDCPPRTDAARGGRLRPPAAYLRRTCAQRLRLPVFRRPAPREPSPQPAHRSLRISPPPAGGTAAAVR